MWILHFLAHGRDQAVARKNIRGLKETDKECPSGGPTRRASVEVAKDELTAPPAVMTYAEDSNHDDDHACRCPVDAELVDEVKVFGTEGVDEEADERDSPEGEDGLPGVRGPTFSPQADGAKKELGAAEVDAEGDCPIADEVHPALCIVSQFQGLLSN